jgi:hypothetical protein
MQGVTAVIVAFVLAALAFPQFVKQKTQIYIAVGAVLGIIVMDAIGHMAIGHEGLMTLIYVIVAIGQVVALIALVQAVGGPTPSEMSGGIGHAIEVVRRGEEEKQVIFPLSAAMGQRTSENAAGSRMMRDEDEKVVYHIDDPEAAAKAPPKDSQPHGPLPLD